MTFFRNNSRVFSGKIGRKLLMIQKTGGLPCAMRLLMKGFSELHALGLFDAVFKLILREDLRLSELNLHVNLARAFLEFFSMVAKCKRYQLSPRSVWSLTTGLVLTSIGEIISLIKVTVKVVNDERC